jgi:ferredoxin
MSTHRISIERDLCSGFGACADLDPESFALGADGVALAVVETTDREAAVTAARGCPMGAIRLLDDAGQVVV